MTLIYQCLLQMQCPQCRGGTSRPLLLFGMFAVAWFLATWVGPKLRKKGDGSMHATRKILPIVALVIAVCTVLALKQRQDNTQPPPADVSAGQAVSAVETAPPTTGLPRLVDVGAGTCIPCKQMMPVLAELRTEYAGRLSVEYYDIRDDPNVITQYDVMVIPTQIFYDASGNERFRHTGFFAKEDILAKWKELGVDLSQGAPPEPAYERFTPAKADNRPKESVCYMCDGDVTAKTRVTVQTAKGPVRLCCPHCYFIMYSCLTEDKTGFEERVTFTDWATGDPVAATEALLLYGQDESTGRPWIKAFAARGEALNERAGGGGSILALPALQQKEMSHRCGFCERACYPQDAAEVRVSDGVRTWGCCSHCALGVAARTGKDIEVREKDRLTGQPVVVKTFEGKIASLNPATAVAWFGQRQRPDGTWGSAGCFHQGFFTNADTLQAWVERNPYETGKLISISQALANKMKLSPEQIKKACKIGECSPK